MKVKAKAAALPVLKAGLSKAAIAQAVQQKISDLVEHGGVLEFAEALAVAEEYTKAIRKEDASVDAVRTEVLLHHGRYESPGGAIIETCEGGVGYDYSADGGWRYLSEHINALVEQRKALEERLRAIPAGKQFVDEETGEVLTGPLKSSKSTYRITLKKSKMNREELAQKIIDTLNAQQDFFRLVQRAKQTHVAHFAQERQRLLELSKEKEKDLRAAAQAILDERNAKQTRLFT